MFRFFLLAAWGSLMSGTPAFACSTTTPCAVETGEYYIQKPESVAEEKSAAVVFIHGFGNSGPAVFRNTGMVTSFLDRGYIVVAPNGLRMTGRNGGSWSFHPDGRKARDEIGFITSIRDDLIANHNVDPDRIILAGFSIGGSMTAYLACAVPEAFPAYAPLAGNFWRPHPESCKGPVRMLHTHGWRDGTVPLEGRVLRGTGLDDPNAVIQGDVFHALTIWRAANGCEQLKADRYETEGFFLRRSWDRCAPGSALEFALFDGGHSVPQAWPDLVMDWFEDLSESSD